MGLDKIEYMDRSHRYFETNDLVFVVIVLSEITVYKSIGFSK